MEVSNSPKLLNLTAKISFNFDDLKKAQLEQKTVEENNENEVYYKLTPADLLEYKEGKEQFIIVDLSEKVYTKPEDAQNYISSTNLMEFLGKYGIVDYDQLQASYDKLFAQGGLALELTNLQEEKPTAEKYWAKEPETPQQQIYGTMYDKVIATLNNYANSMCSCVFYAIASMLSYTDVASVTDKEIFEAARNIGLIQDEMPVEEQPVVEEVSEEPVKEIVEEAPVEEVSTEETEVQAEKSLTDLNRTEREGIRKDISAHQPTTVAKYTSTGKKVSIPNVSADDVFKKLNSSRHKSDVKNYVVTDDSELRADKAQVNQRLSSLRSQMYAAERAERLNPDAKLEGGMTDLSTLTADAQRLFSNYEIDENGNYVLTSEGQRQLKTLQQKIIDTFAIAQDCINMNIPQGSKNDTEKDATVQGALKSTEKDIQKAMGAENFDLEKYKADYSKWADEYAEKARAFDVEYKNFQKLQDIEDAEQAQWYTNLWTSMGGEEVKPGENIEVDIEKSGVKHGHAHGHYSNEIKREFKIPDNISFKNKDNFVALDDEKLNSEEWLKSALANGKISVKKFEKPAEKKEISYNQPSQTSVKREHHEHNLEKELNTYKKLTDNSGYNSFM